MDFYSEVMCQHGEEGGIDFYNTVLGGVSKSMAGEKQKGFNELVNLYYQQHSEKRIPKFTLLYKQILSDRQTESYSYDLFATDKELIEAVEDFYCQKNSFTDTCIRDNIKELTKLLKGLSQFDLSHIYVAKDDVTAISHELFGDWSYLRNLLAEEAQQQAESVKTKRDKEKILNSIDKRKYFELEQLENLVRHAPKRTDESGNEIEQPKSILGFWTSIVEKQKLVEQTFKTFKADVVAKKEEYSTTNSLRSNEADIEKIKDFLDAIIDFFHRVKTLIVPEELERDMELYSSLTELYEPLQGIVKLYNLTRSTLTQKAGAVEKFKLNFENPTLANGWDENKEQANSCIILRKDGKYFLGILNAKNKAKYSDLSDDSGKPYYEKMVYKLLSKVNANLPRVFLLSKQSNPPSDILEGYKAEKHKKGTKFDLNFCHKLIDHFKKLIAQHPDWSKFGFQFSDTKDYEDISGFYREIESQGYKIDFKKVSEKQVDQWVEEGKLFLFQIYCKDFAEGTTGKKNLHTLYLEQLFSDENLKDVVFKLDGEAELFYRPVSSQLGQPFAHKLGQKLVNRRLSDGTPIPEAVFAELFKLHNKQPEKAELSEKTKEWLNKKNDKGESRKSLVVVKDVTHEIVKDRRYTKEQFQIHLKTKINFKAGDTPKDFNGKVLEVLKDNPDVNIIGLDRGERNLIYLSVINQQGKILYQKSLNVVGSDRQAMDYQSRLKDREGERAESRKSWKTIGKIKYLKEGYLSQVVHEIVTLMIRYRAIVVMEDLNVGFKRGRFRVERQVYQKLEKALIDKLNYLTFKSEAPVEYDKSNQTPKPIKPTQPGGLLNGYQLTPKDVKMNKIGKQCGFLFYVPAGYTSKIDPATGFVNRIPFKDQIEKSQQLYAKMKSIRFKENSFEFTFDYKDLIEEETNSHVWTICTHNEDLWIKRLNKQINKWEPYPLNVTQQLKTMFDSYGIEYQSGQELKSTITNQTKSRFFAKLNWLLKMTLQMRYGNGVTGSRDEDYILSPIRNADGTFFDSRLYFDQAQQEDSSSMPIDADANGAYHIALKGLWSIQHGIEMDKKGKLSVTPIRNSDWFDYAVQRFEEKK